MEGTKFGSVRCRDCPKMTGMDRIIQRLLSAVVTAAVAVVAVTLPADTTTNDKAALAGANQTDVVSEDSRAAARTAMVRRIDEVLQQSWEAEGVEPAQPAEDGEFLRRAYLDLTGVIPRVSDVRQYLADTSPDKQDRLIERLLASPRYATHMATTWRNRMLPASVDTTQATQILGVQNWLHRHFAKNTRFDNVVADLLVATDGNELGPALYYQAQDLAPEKLAANTAELFLGIRLHCAQCHDHPYSRWTQDDFWGLAAFFARVRGPDAARPDMSYRLVDAPAGEVRLPDSNEVVDPKYLGGRYADESEGGTRRLQLAIWMASRDNPYLARATANWAWSHLFGRGIVEPVSDAGSHNPPSHPELLDELAQYVTRIDFDLKELWRTLMRTRAYRLSSRPGESDRSPPHLFASMNAKPLSAEQLYDSIMLTAPPRDGVTAESDMRARIMVTSLVLDPQRAEFLRRTDTSSADTREYSAGILQALLLMNGDVMTAVTSPEESGLVGALDAPFMTDEQRIDALFLATLSRFPAPHEKTTCLQLLTSDSDSEPDEVLSDMLWSLFNSTEFTFNH
jgi:hypothetical protein